MIFGHPPNKRYRFNTPDRSPMETVVMHLSPIGVGRIGGEMVRRMVDAAENYLQEITANEIRKAFHNEVRQSIGGNEEASTARQGSKFPTPPISPSGGEARASQYPSGNEPH